MSLTHAARVEVEHPLIEAGQPGLALADQLGLERPGAVARGTDLDRAEVGRTVLAVCPLRRRRRRRRRLPRQIAEVAGQLRAQCGLDHPAGELARVRPGR